MTNQDLMIWENLSLPRWKKTKKKKKLLLRNHALEKTRILRMSLYNHSMTSESSEGESIKLHKRLLK